MDQLCSLCIRDLSRNNLAYLYFSCQAHKVCQTCYNFLLESVKYSSDKAVRCPLHSLSNTFLNNSKIIESQTKIIDQHSKKIEKASQITKNVRPPLTWVSAFKETPRDSFDSKLFAKKDNAEIENFPFSPKNLPENTQNSSPEVEIPAKKDKTPFYFVVDPLLEQDNSYSFDIESLSQSQNSKKKSITPLKDKKHFENLKTPEQKSSNKENLKKSSSKLHSSLSHIPRDPPFKNSVLSQSEREIPIDQSINALNGGLDASNQLMNMSFPPSLAVSSFCEEKMGREFDLKEQEIGVIFRYWKKT